ncbi:Ig-like domain-containing protein [Leucobacter chromiiresistens]|uniref:Ig-like domain-containing protein n=1 Tax=Leucobacter chromiiresistens TaxID=1079994 RepID=UPI00073465C9|nr:Ig-like domain-containing protein [Leucobacter chromiiresistens]
MSAPPSAGRERFRRLQWWIAGAVSCALIATVAVIANGYDARETPRAEPGVWVAREAGQYARVNTDTGELDLVRKVADPSGVLQSGARAAVLSHGNGRAWPLDAGDPVDLGDRAPAAASGDEAADGDAAGEGTATPVSDAEEGEGDAAGAAAGGGAEAVRLPDGTRDVVSAGRFVAVRTESGAVYAGEIAADASTPALGGAGSAATDLSGDDGALADLESRLASLVRVDPLASEDDAADGDAANGGAADDGGAAGGGAAESVDGGSSYRASAIALTESGRVALFSGDDDAVREYDLTRREFVGGTREVPAEAGDAPAPQLALVAGDWALLDPESGVLWREGGGSTELDLDGSARLQASGGDGAREGRSVLVADTSGLTVVDAEGEAERVVETTGTPAQPVYIDEVAYAAWVGQNSGALWTSEEGEKPLVIDESAREAGDLLPVIRSNGERGVLNEMRTGMLWTLPGGDLIPLSQWTISDPPKEDRGTVVVEDVTEQVPPTAVDDEFGVRAGEPAPLPVLLNDYDANKRDVLTIVPDSIGEPGLPESFGALQLMPDGQSLTVQPAADASGSATFTYRVTDGALVSEPATVTLTVVDDETNTAPAWCPVEGCQREWRVPSIAPGGTLVYPVLEGWVDPEGDVMTLAAAEAVRSEDPVRAIVTADGRLGIRHTDPNAGASDVALRITVRDGRGEEAQRELTLVVDPSATPEFTATATTVQVGRTATVRPLDRVAGGSGSFALLDATDPSGTVQVTPKPTSGAVEIAASAAGTAAVTVTVRDTVTGGEITGQVRVTATPAGPPLALPALRAFVRPLTDATVEILDAIPGAASRSLSVAEADVADGDLQADLIDHAQVRVAGSTADGGAGRIGSVDVTVAEGDARATGKLTVFQVPDTGATGAIAVADTATVRAGSVVDIRVLDNDVAAPGERLLLDPEIVGSGAKGELAFASGNVLRYLAPDQPGTYRLSYTAYGASDPAAGDVGSVIVTVLPEGSNRDPEPAAVTARVSPGSTTQVRVPLSGVDPDGDRVRLVSVEGDTDAGVSATVNDAANGFDVAALADAAEGPVELTYGVRDAEGATGTGRLSVIVVPATESSAIVASTDYLRLTPQSEPAVVRPLDNDVDPAGGALTIESVVPNVVGGANSPEARRLAERLDLSQLEEGRISVQPGDELGAVSYRYTVRSAATKSTADGLIVVHTSERVGAQAPSITDTVLNVRDRAELAAGGVDVVTDKVRWATGDVSKLKLSLWSGTRDGYRVSGSKISGEYRPGGDTVVFKLTGTDASGQEVASYGLLVVPPLDELRLTLKPDLQPIKVDENEQREVAVSDLVDTGSGDRVELRRESFAVGRAQATCEAVSADRLRYSAGREAPWNDSCLMQARLVGQKTWTTLPVPVVVVPDEPAVQAAPLTRTVDPGTSATIELVDMVTWQGGREGDASKLRFEVSGGTSLFSVVQKGATLSVEARADAVPGSQESVSVAVSGAGASRAPLTLRVGQAPRDLPKGATVALQCTVGSSCQTQLVGVSGEHDPFAGKSGGGLKLAAVSGAGCSYGSFTRVGDSGVSVSWPGGPEIGGTCRVGFTVVDAQGRTGEGVIEFDAQGLPSRPSIQQTGYTADSASFTVTLGGRPAHPAVSGVNLSGGGSTSCTAVGGASFQCVATGLANGQKHQFTAQAVNAVGSSAASTAVTAWAYAAPAAPKVTVEPIKNPRNTDQGTGGVRLSVSGSSDTRSFAVSYRGVDGGTIDGAQGSREYTGLAVGAVSFTVTPTTRFDVPEIGGGSNTGAAAQGDGFVYGAPRLSRASLTTTGDNSAVVGHDGTSDGVTSRYTISDPYGQPGDCFADGQLNDPNFKALKKYRVYTAKVCLSNEFGRSEVTTNPELIGGSVPRPTASFTIGFDPRAAETGYDYALSSAEIATVEGAVGQWSVGNAVVAADQLGSALRADSAQKVRARQCIDTRNESSCSDWADARVNTAPTVVTIREQGTCWVAASPPRTAEEKRALLSISAAARESAIVTEGVPEGERIPLTITWTGDYRNLAPVTVSVCYQPETPTPPEPGGDPDPTTPQTP